jgi:hypothetical protein
MCSRKYLKLFKKLCVSDVPIGQPLALGIIQRHEGQEVGGAEATVQELQQSGITINTTKSVLRSMKRLPYLGIDADLGQRSTPTTATANQCQRPPPKTHDDSGHESTTGPQTSKHLHTNKARMHSIGQFRTVKHFRHMLEAVTSFSTTTNR